MAAACIVHGEQVIACRGLTGNPEAKDLDIVSTTELLGRNSSDSGLEIREYGFGNLLC
jgi:hypothetical protein